MEKIESIAKRNLERKLDIQKRRDEKGNELADGEKICVFEKTFYEKKNEIEKLLSECCNVKIQDLPDHLNVISKQILALQKYAAQSSIFLRSYDIQKCHETIQELTNTAKDLENKLLPKKKFGFKNKITSNKSISKRNGKDEVDFKISNENCVTIANRSSADCGFFNKTNETLCLKKLEVDKKDVILEDLINCTVYLYGTPSTLHMTNLKQCSVYTGPVSTSIFLDNCHHSNFHIACQQLRIHRSSLLYLYLHVTSRTIIEDCNQIYISPYDWNYEESNQDWMDSGLDRDINNWDQVDDFNWLNAEQKSPNWDIVDMGSKLK